MASVELPNALTARIAESQIEVVSWSFASTELVLRITNQVGPESGTLRLNGVAYVNLPPQFEVAGIAAYDSAFPDRPQLQLSDGQIAVCFQADDSTVHFVVAESIQYSVEP